jgi:ribosomal-protein-serine acetyltransferase
MFRLALTEERWLRLFEETDAAELHDVILANRDYLARRLPWAAHQTLEDTAAFIRRTRTQLENNDGFQTAVVENDTIIGAIGFTGVSWRHRSTTIGYWLAESAQGRGTMGRAVSALVDHAFDTWRLSRVDIRVDIDNDRSRAIPERLGFIEEHVPLEAELLGERYSDQMIYVMLRHNWK